MILYCYLLLIPQNGKGGDSWPKMKLQLHLLVLCVIIVFLVYNMAIFQHKQTSVTINIPWFTVLNTVLWTQIYLKDESDVIMQFYSWKQNLDHLIRLIQWRYVNTLFPSKVINFVFPYWLRLQFEHQASDRAAVKVSPKAVARIGYLPEGVVESNSDMELKPLWLTTGAQSQVSWVQLN